MKKDSNKAIYLYCLTRSDYLESIEEKGVDGQGPIFLHIFKEVAAIVSMVFLDEFCGPSGESRMQDLSWVGPRARRHEKIIEQVMHHSPVFPARFGTLFSSPSSLDKLLQKHHDTILQFLDRVIDKEEWSVKVLLDRTKAKEKRLSMMFSKESEHLASLAPGKRYFREQQIRAVIEKELSDWLKEICMGIADDISDYATDFFERKLLPYGATGTDGEIIFNWAFLVPQNTMSVFLERIKQLNADHASQGLTFAISGPWPPYSFTPSVDK